MIYIIQNPETAEWAAKMTGSILVDDEMRKVRTDLSLTEKVDTDRMIRQAESYYVDSNMFWGLRANGTKTYAKEITNCYN